MKRLMSQLIFCFLGFLILPIGLFSQKLDVSFEIKHAGIPVDVSFSQSEVEFEFDTLSLGTSYFNAIVDVESLNTSIKARDRHLLKEKYFYVGEYPQMIFHSLKVYELGGAFFVKGDLTIRGVTNQVEVPIDVSVNSIVGRFTLNRIDYGVGRKHLFLSDEVKVVLKLSY